MSKTIYADYYSSAANTTITKTRAFQELHNHGVIDTSEFIAECGDRETYDAQALLAWLGY